MNNWFVITGGPCSGKTTTIKLLNNKGYKSTFETARKHIDERIKNGETLDQIRNNPQHLQDNIAKEQIKLEDSLNPYEIVFLDRALPDSLAYYRFLNLEYSEFKEYLLNKPKYKAVFFMDTLPYSNDEIRNESEAEAKLITDNLLRAYNELEIPIVNVPVMDKEERVKFIIDKARSL